jgi:peptidoglycan hydrolase-like protein with peptidoglycan-binding domain
LVIREGNLVCELEVLADALQVGEVGDSVRVATTAETAERIAREVGAYLLTPRLLDWVRVEAAVRIAPQTQTSWADGTMAKTHRMVEHHLAVEESVGGRKGLVDNAGKIWAVSTKVLAHPPLACNYGWFVGSGGSPAASPWAGRVIQPASHGHNTDHVDYSQTVRVVREWVKVNGVTMELPKVAVDPGLCKLVSHQGPLHGLQYPIDTEAPTVVVPSPDEWDDPRKWRPTMRRSDDGPDVAAWQRVLMGDGFDLGPWKDDGDFGNRTHNATVGWQRMHRLTPDGIVGPATRAAIGKLLDVEEPITAVDARPKVQFIEATNYTRGVDRTRMNWVVLHSMEAAEAATTAENVARWFASKTNAPRASAHYNVDSDSVVQSVPEEKIAWHAPGANRLGVGVEHAGYARQTREEWLDEYSEAMLRRSAQLVAGICKRWNIPPQFVDADGLKEGVRGITTHWETTKAWRKSTHWDPGRGFPMDVYLGWVQEALDATT